MNISGYRKLPEGDEILVCIALAIHGPIPIGIDARAESFHKNTSSMYFDQVRRSSNIKLNPTVLLVGYRRDNVDGEYRPIKNSWGTNWGDKGHMKIARNLRNPCGVASYAVIPFG